EGGPNRQRGGIRDRDRPVTHGEGAGGTRRAVDAQVVPGERAARQPHVGRTDSAVCVGRREVHVHIGDAALAARGILAHARRIAQEGIEVDAPAVQRAIPGQWAGERERTVHLPTAAERMRLELAEPQVVVGIAETTPEVRYLRAANTRGAGAYAPVGERDVPL